MCNYSELRRKFIEYHNTDPKQLLDFSTAEDYGDGRVIFNKLTLEKFLNIERLGAGCFATVYDLGNNRVLKVCSRLDQGYDSYIAACKANRDNPHLPKLHYRGEWAGRIVYILDKLTPLDYSVRDMVVSICRSAARNETPTISPLLNPTAFGQGLLDACAIVSKFAASDYRYGVDIHGDNIMMDSMGRVVLSDPLTHG